MQRFAILILFLGLTSCYTDPFANPYDWSITGAVDKNIAAQAADPADLIAGKSDPNASGVAANAAVDKALGGPAGTASGLLTPPPPQSTLNITGS